MIQVPSPILASEILTTPPLSWKADHGSGDNYTDAGRSWSPELPGTTWGNYTGVLTGDFEFHFAVHRNPAHDILQGMSHYSMNFICGFVWRKDGTPIDLSEFQSNWVQGSEYPGAWSGPRTSSYQIYADPASNDQYQWWHGFGSGFQQALTRTYWLKRVGSTITWGRLADTHQQAADASYPFGHPYSPVKEWGANTNGDVVDIASVDTSVPMVFYCFPHWWSKDIMNGETRVELIPQTGQETAELEYRPMITPNINNNTIFWQIASTVTATGEPADMSNLVDNLQYTFMFNSTQQINGFHMHTHDIGGSHSHTHFGDNLSHPIYGILTKNGMSITVTYNSSNYTHTNVHELKFEVKYGTPITDDMKMYFHSQVIFPNG